MKIALLEKYIKQEFSSITKLCGRKKGAHLLDCGCGAGEITIRVADTIGAREIYGIELDGERAKKAKQKGIKVYSCDLNSQFPFKSNFFDIVVSRQVIEHLIDIDNFVKEIYRVLKPDGYAVVSTINLASWPNVLALVVGFQPFSSQLSAEYEMGNPLSPVYGKKIVPPHNPYVIHKKIFAYQGLKEFFTWHGFVLDKIVGAGYFPFPPKLASVLSYLDKLHAHFIIIKARKPIK